jgi:hypothetical protein
VIAADHRCALLNGVARGRLRCVDPPPAGCARFYRECHGRAAGPAQGAGLANPEAARGCNPASEYVGRPTRIADAHAGTVSGSAGAARGVRAQLRANETEAALETLRKARKEAPSRPAPKRRDPPARAQVLEQGERFAEAADSLTVSRPRLDS